ncbi:hypothetical protein CDL15_Pgr005338 [Punica granatum]|uniref:Protein FAR1-RELATED SEQUENCE n=1 Tax=Punica granatum TaxID=22663 RepID=A0A218XDQ9_PUNGR|nr:hypothetical protein CDL15_Pgr005338 [Punica granatum]
MCMASIHQLWFRFAVDEQPAAGDEDRNPAESLRGGEEGLPVTESSPSSEPFVGMGFGSEEAAKAFYDAYATRLGFVTRVDRQRRS